MPSGAFWTGLLGGFGQSMQASIQRRQEEEAKTAAQESAVLNHLATTSTDPEVRAMALSGLMEMTQGKKRTGILGLGKLKATPSFQKLMELGQRAGIMPASAGAPPAGPGAAAAAGTGAGPEPGMLDTAAAAPDQTQVTRDVGTPSSPLAGLTAAQGTSSPTTGGAINPVGAGGPPGAPPSVASLVPGDSPLLDKSEDPMTLVHPDKFGTLDPVSAEAMRARIAQMDPKARETFDRQIALERVKDQNRRAEENAKQRETQARDDRKAREAEKLAQDRADQQAAREDARAQASDARTNKMIAGMSDRQSKAESDREARDSKKEKDRWRNQLEDDFYSIQRKVTDPEIAKRISPNAAKELQKEALRGYYRKIGEPRTDLELDLEVENRRLPPAGGGASSGPPPAPAATLPGAPPAGPPASTPGVGAPRVAAAAAAPAAVAGGPPAAPPELQAVPNWSQIASVAEAQRRQGKTPAQILELAKAHLSALQVQALKRYLKL